MLHIVWVIQYDSYSIFTAWERPINFPIKTILIGLKSDFQFSVSDPLAKWPKATKLPGSSKLFKDIIRQRESRESTVCILIELVKSNQPFISFREVFSLISIVMRHSWQVFFFLPWKAVLVDSLTASPWPVFGQSIANVLVLWPRNFVIFDENLLEDSYKRSLRYKRLQLAQIFTFIEYSHIKRYETVFYEVFYWINLCQYSYQS